jgi:RNA polymerase sigma-70 factor (ECF subfamily)
VSRARLEAHEPRDPTRGPDPLDARGPLEAPIAARERGALVGLAYRMLGSRADAEDLVQEALLRWHERPDKASVEHPRAYRERIVVHLCLDRLKSARARREVYVGPWLPEPILEDVSALAPDAGAASELASDLSVALMLTLERLSPLERAAFVLHDVFDVEWAEVARTLARSEVACRKLASRAREHVRREGARYQPSREACEGVQAAFAMALATGDASALAGLLAEDAVFVSDGGGRVKAALRPVRSRARVTRLLLGLRQKTLMKGGATARPALVNGLPGFVIEQPEGALGGALQTLALEVGRDGLIHALYTVSNPDKLRGLRAT